MHAATLRRRVDPRACQRSCACTASLRGCGRWQPLRRAHSTGAAGEGASEESVREPRKVTVYTRTGDKGTSSLYNGTRQTKGHDVFHALGMTDSLNAHLGLAREHLLSQKPMAKGLQLCDELEQLQSALIDLGAAVATPPSSSSPEQLARVAFDGTGRAAQLERWIDAHEEALPPLRTFVLPGGGIFAAHLHVARTVARETERTLVMLHEAPAEAGGGLAPGVLSFANRLSDYLFVAGRVAAALPSPWGGVERPYVPCQPEPQE
jgi:cob(I)alamin adenosyltransferase